MTNLSTSLSRISKLHLDNLEFQIASSTVSLDSKKQALTAFDALIKIYVYRSNRDLLKYAGAISSVAAIDDTLINDWGFLSKQSDQQLAETIIDLLHAVDVFTGQSSD
jgi:hypothetical protein